MFRDQDTLVKQKKTLDDELKELLEEAAKHDHHHHHDDDEDEHEHEHHHHHHDDDEDEHEHHHHHHHDEEEHEHEHHHHHHDDEEDEHHHHEHGPDCTCGCHDHDHDHEHHHHHHADDVFTSWGRETTRTYTVEEITAALNALGDEEKYGMILRAKGIVAGADGKWIHYDYVPGVPDVRSGSASTIGRLCVIGSKINEEAIAELFNA